MSEVLVIEDLRRVALADDVQWLFHILEHNFAAFLEACYLYFYYFSDASFVVSEVLDTLVILDDARYAKIQTTKYDSLLNIFYEGQNVRIYVQCTHICNIPINKSISNTFPGVAQNLVVQFR